MRWRLLKSHEQNCLNVTEDVATTVAMTDEELDLGFEIYDQLSDAVPTDQRVKHWLDRTEGHVQRQARFDMGNNFEDSYRLGLSNNVEGAATAEYLGLKARIADLDERTILSNVQLCIRTPCNKSGNYFIPDFIAVRKMTDEITDNEF